ncbi:hypothetical protein [Mycoplasma marinum]|nr:hypothetical protein [Mycoplasma marinum]
MHSKKDEQKDILIKSIKIKKESPQEFFLMPKYKNPNSYESVKNQIKFDQKHEILGFEFFKNSGFSPLLRVHNKLHGFDGLFIRERIYFYEAKYRQKSSLSTLVSSAVKTITKPVKGRESELGNVEDKLRTAKLQTSKEKAIVTYRETYALKETLSIDDCIFKINDILENIKEGRETPIYKSEMLLNLGSNQDITSSKANSKVMKSLESYGGSLVVEYE